MAKYAVQSQKHLLAGSGVNSTVTSITVRSLQFPDETNITMSEFGDIGYATLEPGTTRVENISFTGITQNADGTATLTGVTRGLDFHTPYAADSSRGKTHDGGTVLIFSNSSPFYSAITLNPTVSTTITGTYTFSTLPQLSSDPVSGNEAARRSWVLSQINGGSVSTDNLTVAGTAGETLSAGDLIYFKTADGEWYLCDADTASTVNNVILGIAQGAGTDGGSISSGVLVRGVDANQSGLTVGAVQYASNTAGGLSETAGTTERIVGQAKSTTEVYFFPNMGELPSASEKDALAGDGGTPSTTNPFQTKYSTRFGVQQMTAGETIAGGTLPVAVYQNKTDNEFYACDGNDTDKLKFLGFAISNGTDGASIDVQFSGIVTGFTGLAEGEKYYVQDDSTIGTSPGTYEVLVGVAISETALLIQKGKRYMSGVTSFSATGNTAITCGFRPSHVRVSAKSLTTAMSKFAVSDGGWTVGGSNACSYIGGEEGGSAPASQSGTSASYAWYLPTSGGGYQHRGQVTTITDTGFTLANTESINEASAVIYWEAEGEL